MAGVAELPGPLVSTQWLAEAIGAPDLVLLDASWYLPSQAADPAARFAEAHLPGALRFDHDEIADVDSPLPHTVPGTARAERCLGALGLRGSERIVCYDQQGMFAAPRAWWLLRLFGAERCAVLDGGLPQWQREHRALEHGPARARAPVRWQARLHARYLRGLGDVWDNLASRAELVLDARSADRFHARVPEPRAGLRGGHIPGSRNLPFATLLDAEQRLLPPAALRERLQAVGARADVPVISTCGSGMTAAIITLALVVAGWPPGALYDGSWTEWGACNDTPVEV